MSPSTAHALKSRTAAEIYEALDTILRAYNAADFTITELRCDNEFRSIMEPVLDDLNIQMNCPPAGEKDGAAAQKETPRTSTNEKKNFVSASSILNLIWDFHLTEEKKKYQPA